MTEDKRKLLIVEDDPGLASQLRWALEEFETEVVEDRESALTAYHKSHPPVVVLDLGLPPDRDGASEGLATLESLMTTKSSTKVIISSGNEDRDNAVKAVALGAYDFYPKPVDIEVLRLIIQRALYLYDLEQDYARLSRSQKETPLSGVIAGSDEMLKVCRMVERIARSDVSVLFTGESGSGKEVLAHALHELSDKADGPFVAINCAAIPEHLLESELFGHEKGAFTGAVKQTIGKVEQADQGTLFLDEIGDMPLALQGKVLRFLQDHKVDRVGGRKSIEIDVRVVSATNRDLEALMGEKLFREDLFYRLNEIGIEIPPVRDRGDDALLLANHFLHKFSQSLDKGAMQLSSEARAVVSAYDWPGNVRELENRIKRALVLASGKLITPENLDLEPADIQSAFPTLKQVRERAELGTVTKALALSRNNISTAAKLLGVSRPTLYELMKNLNLRD
ncbi:MAG: PEP-CTERM-box response regulator transcription factor [Alphaproteobacteria bacterium]|nr:PEP-CTERM-box response regulator transcription factor [Alphaproteobacteria bacterium]MDP6517339.1 PEP-CTERM-box response regulator transcription factor [Alphaproteobacteria bacterium]